MKILLGLLLLLSTQAFSASVRVLPFNFDIYLDNSRYDVDFKLKMACRYEKFVISDSAEFEYKFEEVPLKIVRFEDRVRVENTFEQSLKMSGMFKYGKECQVISNFFFVDKKYAKGWANQYDRPIRMGVLDHTQFEENFIFDGTLLKNLFENKEITFEMKSYPKSNQINLWLAFDGERLPDNSAYLFSTALKNPETNLPYEL